PKHRNERKTHNALITSYHVPGLYVEDHSIDVPLDWRGLEPMLLAVGSTMRRGAMPAPIAGAPESIKLFYRVVCAPDRINDDLPLLLFLQGGPGGESPRPLSPTSDGWIEEAVKHFRVVLPDQRGTGRSSCVDGRTIRHWVIAQRPPAPIQHARRRTSSSATSPAPSCAILSTCA
ncbi:MAG: alpha/beta fold hydrolase, partial [Collinsella sp.]